MTKFNFKISKNIEDDCLKKNWISIYNHSDINSFFSSYEWNHNLFKYVYCDKKSYFLSIYNADECICIIPFYILNMLNLKVIFIYGDIISDYSTIVSQDISYFEDFDINLCSILQSKLKTKNIVFQKITNQQELIIKKIFNLNHITAFTIYKTFQRKLKLIDNFYSFKSKINSDTKRCLRQLQLKGKLKYIFDTKDINLQKLIFNTTLKFKSLQYQRTNQRNIFNENKYLNFYKSLLLESSDNISFSSLYLDNKIISAHIGYYMNKKYYYIFPSYDYRFKRYSPGKILLEYLLKSLSENKISIFDFTIGDENYKKNWSDTSEDIKSFIIGSNYFKFIFRGFIVLKSILSKFNFAKFIYFKLIKINFLK